MTESHVNNCVIRIRLTFLPGTPKLRQKRKRRLVALLFRRFSACEPRRESFGKELMRGKLQSKKLSVRAFHAESLKMTRGEMEGVSIELRQTGGYSSYRTSERAALSLRSGLSIMAREMLALTGCNLDRWKAGRSLFVDRRGQTGKRRVGEALSKFSDC